MESVVVRLDLVGVLQETIDLLTSTDVVWTEHGSVGDLRNELSSYLSKAKHEDLTEDDIRRLKLLFAPTGALQDVSLSGSWSHRYLELAERFDSYCS